MAPRGIHIHSYWTAFIDLKTPRFGPFLRYTSRFLEIRYIGVVPPPPELTMKRLLMTTPPQKAPRFGDYEVRALSLSSLMNRCIRAVGELLSSFDPSSSTLSLRSRSRSLSTLAAQRVSRVRPWHNDVWCMRGSSRYTPHHPFQSAPAPGPVDSFQLKCGDALSQSPTSHWDHCPHLDCPLPDYGTG